MNDTVAQITGASSVIAGTSTTYTAPATTITGGSIANIGGYNIHTFTSNGSFTLPTGFAINAELLVVAGGGGGGNRHAGGGGAGGLLYNSSTSINATQAVVIGGGGADSDVSIGDDGRSGIIRWDGKPSRDKQIAILIFIGFQRSNQFVREQVFGDFPGLCIGFCGDNIVRRFL